MTISLPEWIRPWLDMLNTVALVALAVLLAWLVRRLVRSLAERVRVRYQLSDKMMAVPLRVVGTFVNVAALFAILQIFGVSGAVLWTAFTGFAAVGAVAFFAAWSVLSNLFCTVLIVVMRPFRLHDRIELLENGEKPGLKGHVIDINMVYTTLLEEGGTTLQVPNNLFFQRTTRRWADDGPGPVRPALAAARGDASG